MMLTKFRNFTCRLTQLTIFFLLGALAGAQVLYLPPSEFGKADLTLVESSIAYENVFGSVADFKPVLSVRDTPYWKVAKSVGRLDILLQRDDGVKVSSYCTASLIAKGHVITNHHCIPGIRPDFKVIRSVLRMGYLSIDQSGQIFEVDIDPIESSSTLDYSILFVQGAPERTYGLIDLENAREPKPLESLFIIHHPKGTPKKLTRDRCYVHPSPQSLSDTEVWHRCDTQDGSSGALVFGEDGKVIGLHWGGFDPSLSDEDRYNVAKKLKTIINQSRFLLTLINPNSTPTPITSSLVGTLQLDTVPTGANVYINGDLIGATPVRDHKLPDGNYNLRFSLKGYEDLNANLVMRANLITRGTLLLKASAVEKAPLALAEPKPQQSLQPVDDFGSTPTTNTPVNTPVPTLSQQPSYPPVTSPPSTVIAQPPVPPLVSTPSPNPAVATPEPIAPPVTVPIPSNTPSNFSGSWHMLGQGGQSSAQNLQFHIATTQTKLSGLWGQGHAHLMRQPAGPSVDFSRESVVGIFLGTKPTGGYSLEVTSVEALSDGLRVNVSIRNPAAGSITTQALTSPWVLVRVGVPNLQKAYVYDNTTNQLLGVAQ